ncbi:MAG: hypothetical protein ABI128_00640 [Rhodanobacter sp.]
MKSISLSFRRAGGEGFTLPAQNYLRTPDAKENVMLAPFRLDPGQEWVHMVGFFNIYSRDDDKEYRRLESAIRTDILQQKEEIFNKDRLCEAAPKNVELATLFFKRHFKWEPGEYELELTIKTDRPEANLTRLYLFSLFETEAEELRNYSDGYKFGDGVYWVSQAQPGILLPVREK